MTGNERQAIVDALIKRGIELKINDRYLAAQAIAPTAFDIDIEFGTAYNAPISLESLAHASVACTVLFVTSEEDIIELKRISNLPRDMRDVGLAERA